MTPVKRAQRKQLGPEKYFAEIGGLEDEATRRKFLDRRRTLATPEVVQRLAESVVQKVRVNPHEALLLAEMAMEIARRLGDQGSLAWALRAKANSLYASGDNRAAVEHHEQAIRIFKSLDVATEEARTLSGSIQPLILLGEYDRALASSERAREIFTRLKLPWRLARLEVNVGNIFHRQDRFEEALVHYERGYQGLLAHQDAEALAVVLSNMATCLITLNDFPRALATYERARAISEQNGMPRLVAQADYNIAYLYYLRGEYSRAIEMLYSIRKSCEAGGDTYHHALCYLDLSEIYLELNLSGEARETADEGAKRFEKLGMAYEASKCVANEAIALGQLGRTVQALERFAKAREKFVLEKNLVWPSLIDLYAGLLLFREGRYFEARRFCVAAAEFFDHSMLAGKAILAHLLLARIAHDVGEPDAAEREVRLALEKLAKIRTPALEHQTHFLLGQIAQQRGDAQAAYAAYQRSRASLESLRGRLQGEELKLPFVKDRLKVYEALVDSCLMGNTSGRRALEVLGYIEAAKSRSMVEMIFPTNHAVLGGDFGQSGMVRRIRDLREELNWYYHRIELEELRPEQSSRVRIEQLQDKAKAHEDELLRVLRDVPANLAEDASSELAAVTPIEKIQKSIPADAALVEYYFAGDRVVAAVLTREDVEIVPLTVLSRIAGLLDLLRSGFAKFRSDRDYARRFAEPLLQATNAHLEDLYAEMIAPLRSLLQGGHVVIVPHGLAHYLPFHAFRSGDEYLSDAFVISYAPSATEFSACQTRPPVTQEASLVLGIPDPRVPEVLSEVQLVASLVPRPEILIGDRATAAAVREKGEASGLLHIATRATYRQDNPMFSGLHLADGDLNLHDLYQMRLGCALATLSGCAAGINPDATGDDLLGLQRGLFCAGARSLVLSLWDVHDRSTTQLLKHFYTGYKQTRSPAIALQSAMQLLRQEYAHPFYWAPLFASGQIIESKPIS